LTIGVEIVERSRRTNAAKKRMVSGVAGRNNMLRKMEVKCNQEVCSLPSTLAEYCKEIEGA